MLKKVEEKIDVINIFFNFTITQTSVIIYNVRKLKAEYTENAPTLITLYLTI